jgi:inosine/xanthosine triphosphate pyrophosphatase family protein
MRRFLNCCTQWLISLIAVPAFRSAMVLCSPDGASIESSEGICWGELLKSAAYPGGGLESLFWIRETRCSYGEMTAAQLSRLGSRGKAARALATHLQKYLNLR